MKEGDQELAVHVALLEVGMDEGIHRVLLWIAVKDGMHRGLLCDEKLKNGICGVVMWLEKGANNMFVECLQKGMRSGIHGVVSKKGDIGGVGTRVKKDMHGLVA